MGKLLKHIEISVYFLLATSTAFAQLPGSRLKISNDDPLWGDTVHVTYTIPDSAKYAEAVYQDTVYCAAMMWGTWRRQTIVIPMSRLKGSADYHCVFRVPDSTYRVRVEICQPSDRLPEGITVFTTRMPGHFEPPGILIAKMKNIDSALAIELTRYPTRIELYYTALEAAKYKAGESIGKASDSLIQSLVVKYLSKLQSYPNHNSAWYLTRALMMRGNDSGDDSITVCVQEAVTHFEYGEIFEDADFWSSAFYPKVVDGKMIMSYTFGRALLPLVARLPHSVMAHEWLRMVSYDTVLNKDSYDHICSAWITSNDVDVLTAIAAAYSHKNSTLFDPAKSLEWSTRAHEVWQSAAGFYSGENIFGSMGRISQILPLELRALNALNRYNEAIQRAKSGIPYCKRSEDRVAVRKEMMHAAAGMKDYATAEQQLREVLTLTTDKARLDIDDLYHARAQKEESCEQYIARIEQTILPTEELPTVTDFEYYTTAGHRGHLRDLRGKIVVLDFWFVGCPGCAVERKSLDAFAEQMKSDTTVALLGIALNDATTLKQYLHSEDPVFPVVALGNDICEKVGIQGYPMHVILDRKGKTVVWEFGGDPQSGERLLAKVQELKAGLK